MASLSAGTWIDSELVHRRASQVGALALPAPCEMCTTRANAPGARFLGSGAPVEAAFRGGRLSLGFVVADLQVGSWVPPSFVEPARRGQRAPCPGSALECGSLLPLLRCHPFLPINSTGGTVSPVKAAASRRTPKLSARRHILDTLLLRYPTPTPLFCVSAGMIGLTGEWRVSAGMVGLRGEKRFTVGS